MKLIASPGKIAVKKHDAKLKGKILLPPNRQKLYEIGEVVAVGRLTDFGQRGELSSKETFRPGDLVLFQLPMAIAGSVSHEIKGELHAFLSVFDIIGKLSSDVIEMKNFQIAGRYVLLEQSVRSPSSIIVLPDNAEEAKKEHIHYGVLQTGKDITLELYKGQEVFANRSRINHLSIENKDLVFVDEQFIDGALEPS